MIDDGLAQIGETARGILADGGKLLLRPAVDGFALFGEIVMSMAAAVLFIEEKAEETHLLHDGPEEAPDSGAPGAGGKSTVRILQIGV